MAKRSDGASRMVDGTDEAATQAIAAGRSIAEVAALLGDNPATVMKTYAHAIPGTESASLAVAALLDGAG